MCIYIYMHGVHIKCCNVAIAQINYPSLKHNTQDSKKQARGQSLEEGSS